MTSKEQEGRFQQQTKQQQKPFYHLYTRFKRSQKTRVYTNY